MLRTNATDTGWEAVRGDTGGLPGRRCGDLIRYMLVQDGIQYSSVGSLRSSGLRMADVALTWLCCGLEKQAQGWHQPSSPGRSAYSEAISSAMPRLCRRTRDSPSGSAPEGIYVGGSKVVHFTCKKETESSDSSDSTSSLISEVSSECQTHEYSLAFSEKK